MDRGVRRYARHWKDYLNKRVGLLCFSETWREPLLWAHYAKSHEGICLGFDIEHSGLTKVQYVETRPNAQDLNLVDPLVVSDQDDTRQFSAPYVKLMALKFRAWEYEREWRLFCPLDGNLDHVSQLYFDEFRATLTLSEVIVGHRSTLTPDRLSALLKGHPGVTVRKARPAHRTFDVVEDRSARKWRQVSTASAT
ncbi:DUF2971 domain-containing protein [Devosia sp. Root635]|uniref:DUF2971 domain-containing protein n=1 Tax=Devosia sp. Root635 TaxID=1736575 RepID=UPI0039B7747F